MNIPDNLKITACGVLLISQDSKVLAFARKSNMKKLGLPAGVREENEDLDVCAARELLEETGIKLNLNDINEIFYYIPDDKQERNLDEYCATFIVRSDQNSNKYQLGEANRDENNELEGIAMWVEPKEFITSSNSAFIDYNTNLLRFAGLI